VKQLLFASVRIACTTIIVALALARRADAIPVFANSGLPGMSNEFMYSLSCTTGLSPIRHACDFNKADGNRVIDADLSYGGMSEPWTVGIAGMRGSAPLYAGPNGTGRYADGELYSREGVYFSFQTPLWLLQTMYYHGYDHQPDAGSPGAPFNNEILELQRALTRRDYVVARYGIASSNTLNRQYIFDCAHSFMPDIKATIELGVSPQSHPSFGVALDMAGPWALGRRLLASLRSVPANGATPAPVSHMNVSAVAGSSGDVNAGAKLVRSNGCEGCHGAALKGGSIGPSLYGIEHRLSSDQIACFIRHPKPPMPTFGFTTDQIDDVVAYLSSLDGGANGAQPTVTFAPNPPTGEAAITVTFPGTPPKDVTVLPIMQMGNSTMQTRPVHLPRSTQDPHVYTGRVVFSMGGPWTIRVEYDGKTLDVPLTVKT
jgi:mono/diheme cytochrome c family protein